MATKKTPTKITRGATPTPTPKEKKIKDEELDEEVEDNEVEDESEEEMSDDEDESGAEPAKLKSKKSDEPVDEYAESTEEKGDYLRQYQYKKVNDRPQLGGKATDPDVGSRAETMKKALLAQRQVEILIPLPEGTDPKVLHSVTLNGYRLDLPTNTYIRVPAQVAEMVRQSNNQTIQAVNSKDNLAGKKDREEALS